MAKLRNSTLDAFVERAVLPAVEITDEALVPDEFCMVTVTMRADLWIDIKDCPQLNGTRKAQAAADPRSPNLSLIAAALQKPCPKCKGFRQIRNEDYTVSSVNIVCPECGGSGRASVPGARLKPAGQHCEVK